MKIYSILLFILVSLFPSSTVKEGPGTLNKSYTEDELYKTIGIIESTLPQVRGHAATLMFKGYLASVEARDSGKGNGVIVFYDVSDPTNPKRVATHDTENTRALFEGHTYGFSVINGRDIVFLLAKTGMQIWDWTDIHAIKHISTIQLPYMNEGDYANTSWWLTMQYPYVYIGGTNTGIAIIDAQNIEKPELVKRVPMSDLGGFPIGSLFACGNFMVCNTFDRPGISVLDISNPISPELIEVIKDEFGYSGLFNGGYFYGIGEKPTIWDMNDPYNVKKVSQYSGEKLGSKGGYGFIQDGYLHQGTSDGYAKIDISNPAQPKLIKKFNKEVPKRDYDGAHVVGNLVFMTCDHGTGSHIFPHQTEPDKMGPKVNFMSPKPNSLNNHPLSRIGLTFSDEINHHTPIGAIVRSQNGESIKGNWSTANAILNFTPSEPLAEGETYEVILPAGSVEDQIGNPMEKTFKAKFSTGTVVNDFKVALEPAKVIQRGDKAIFSVNASAGEELANIEYAWDFGDGSKLSSFSKEVKVSHTFPKPGRYPVVLHAKLNDERASTQLTQLVVKPLTKHTPKHSATIAYNKQSNQVWNVNPDNGTVSVVDGKTLELLAEIPVGEHPRTLSIANGWVAVAEQDMAKLYLIDAKTFKVKKIIMLPYGSQPYGVVLSHDAKKAWVASQALGQIFEVNCTSEKVKEIKKTGYSLRGLALDAEGRRLLATRFRSTDKGGEILSINLKNKKISQIELPIDTSTDSEDSGRGVPNYISQVVISPDGETAWIPSKKDNIQRGLASDGLRPTFENTVRTIASQIDLRSNKEVIAHRQDFNDKDMANAVVFSPKGNLVFVAFQGVNKVDVIDAYSGEQLTSIIKVGAAPQGLALNPNGTLYVHNFLDRSIASFDVSDILENGNGVGKKIGVVTTVQNEKLDAQVLVGKRIFYHAGNIKMSKDSYISCASCHLDGGQDGRVWDFTERKEGFRNTISLQGRAGTKHGALHWTANFDEVQDFEHDIRNAFAGEGFLDNSLTRKNFAYKHSSLGYPKKGQSEDLDALAAYVSSLTKVPDSPYRNSNGKLTKAGLRGKKIFQNLECTNCHGGKEFTDSPKGFVHNVGTWTAKSGQRMGQKILGFDTPTLKGVWATAPYLHDGSAATIKEILVDRNKEDLHGKVSTLSKSELNDLISFIKQIDENEPSAGENKLPKGENSHHLISQNEIAKDILGAVQSVKAIAPVSVKLPKDTSLGDAYAIQSVFDQYMTDTLGEITGYKMAFCSEASQKKWGIPAPVSGALHKQQEVKDGGIVKANTFIGFHIESEIAFVLKRDIKKKLTLKQLNWHIQSVHLGLDVPDLRYDRSKGKLTSVDVVAMSCGAHTYVLGKGRKPYGIDYSKITLNLKHDGKLVYEGKSTNVLGNPLEALLALSHQMLERGDYLKAGQVILAGSVAGAYMPAIPNRKGEYIAEGTGLAPVKLIVE